MWRASPSEIPACRDASKGNAVPRTSFHERRRASAPSRIAMFGTHGLVVHPSDEANEVFPTRRLKLPNPVSTPSDQTYRVQLVIYQ